MKKHLHSKTDSGKGDKPRKVTKQYEENYTEIFPNAFKPKWQVELESKQDEQNSTK